MLRLGKKCPGGIFTGEDLYYESVIELKEVFAEFLVYENIKWEIPDSAFIFWTHHDYKFYFFDVEDGNNPPVYVFIQGDTQPKRVATSFSVQLTVFYVKHEHVMKNLR
ncbi:MAG: SMI1/KNR4 family protein [Chloroflexota bacterium]